jgi:O-antigen/teichoic acid export membrane protein
MTMTGLERQAARIMGVIVVLNLLLNGVLIPQFGIAGAALATACSTAVWNLAMLITVWRRRRLNPSILPANPMAGATGQ